MQNTREPTIYLCRHGDTAWSGDRRLAGRTDLPLIGQGEQNAVQLGKRLRTIRFDSVLVSPLLRARQTAERAGYGEVAVIEPLLIEMNFGDYEGKTTEEIRRNRPGWAYLRDGCPGGETADMLGARADALLKQIREQGGHFLLFGHSVISRVLTARWLGLSAGHGRNFMLSPGSISILAYDAVEEAPAIASWNDRHHLVGQDSFA
jgi:broad specificity phosphatase PhoE